jgi:pyruvate/2-oxoglutarate dehydrogenase complex dihydrolipoamide dehydrogenase (E3) component
MKKFEQNHLLNDRETQIKRAHSAHQNSLANNGVTLRNSLGRFIDRNTGKVNGKIQRRSYSNCIW